MTEFVMKNASRVLLFDLLAVATSCDRSGLDLPRVIITKSAFVYRLQQHREFTRAQRIKLTYGFDGAMNDDR